MGMTLLLLCLTLSCSGFGSAQQSIEDPSSKFCGKSVNKSHYFLNNSISCDFKNGIIINNSNTNFDFNSSSLLGSGYLSPYTGILISNVSNVTIQGDGQIGHFATGLVVNNSKNVYISDINFTGNEDSIRVINSSGILIIDNYLYTNTAGIKFHNVNNSVVLTNFFDSNDIAAISLFESYDNIIGNNLISSSLNGIFIDNMSNNITINSNVFTRNFGVEVNIGNGKEINEPLNLVSNNTCTISIPEFIC